ncbi:MAG: DNA primase [Sneathiella sp.]
MAFPPQFLDEIRSRVSLAELIGRRTKLIKKGREFSGLCPFHNEKSPSFTVNEDKGFYHCFGCGAHGDHVDFVRQTEGVEFPEAIERLADLAGLQMPVQRPEEKKHQQKTATLHEVMEVATSWFISQLAGQIGLGARKYLENRAMPRAAIEEFRLGYAPNGRTAMKDALIARGIPEALQIEAGLIIKPDDGRDSYDRFRDRLMFPISDPRGRVIAFGGRTLSDAPAKYLNSPETPLFHKGSVLYNMASARKHAFDHGNVVVAEGYMDVIALSSAGVQQSVAPLGTAITENQLQVLWRMAPEPTMCLDGDAAGWKAAIRAAERALPMLKPGFSLRFALLPDGLDPDDLIQQQGVDAIRDVLVNALPLSDLLWKKEFEDREMKTPEQKAAFEAALMALCDQISDDTVKGYYRKHFKDRLRKWSQVESESRNSSWNKEKNSNRFERFANQKDGKYKKKVFSPPLQVGIKMGRGEGLLILAVVNHPEILESCFEDFAAMQLSSGHLDRLRCAIIEVATSESNLDYEGMKHQLTIRGLMDLIGKLKQLTSESLDWFVEKDAALEDARRGWQHLLARHKRDTLVRDLKLAQEQLEEDMTRENLDRLNIALKALEEAAGNEVDLDGFGIASGKETSF